MSGFKAHAPDLVPVLSRGKHRNPRRGACFMEMASYLAGERWSDHPACTHPLLAALARDVNDYTSDAGRARLVELIPSVIGLTCDDPHIDARIALMSARMALPVVAAGRQQVLAVSVVVCELVLADLDGRPPGWLSGPSRAALAHVPDAARWARDFTRDLPIDTKAFRLRSAPFTVHAAAEGVARACLAQPDDLLRDLLIGAIGEFAARPGGQSAAGAVAQSAGVALATGGSGGPGDGQPLDAALEVRSQVRGLARVAE